MNTMEGIAYTVPSALKWTAALFEGSPYPPLPHRTDGRTHTTSLMFDRT